VDEYSDIDFWVDFEDEFEEQANIYLSISAGNYTAALAMNILTKKTPLSKQQKLYSIRLV